MSLGLPLIGRTHNVCGARALLLGASTWIVGMLGGELAAPQSDLGRAWRALHYSR